MADPALPERAITSRWSPRIAAGIPRRCSLASHGSRVGTAPTRRHRCGRDQWPRRPRTQSRRSSCRIRTTATCTEAQCSRWSTSAARCSSSIASTPRRTSTMSVRRSSDCSPTTTCGSGCAAQRSCIRHPTPPRPSRDAPQLLMSRGDVALISAATPSTYAAPNRRDALPSAAYHRHVGGPNVDHSPFVLRGGDRPRRAASGRPLYRGNAVARPAETLTTPGLPQAAEAASRGCGSQAPGKLVDRLDRPDLPRADWTGSERRRRTRPADAETRSPPERPPSTGSVTVSPHLVSGGVAEPVVVTTEVVGVPPSAADGCLSPARLDRLRDEAIEATAVAARGKNPCTRLVPIADGPRQCNRTANDIPATANASGGFSSRPVEGPRAARPALMNRARRRRPFPAAAPASSASSATKAVVRGASP